MGNSVSLSFFIAQRFRRFRRRSGMLFLISFISTLSIALGVAVLIIGLSAMNGFEKELKDRVLAVIPHGELFYPHKTLSNWREVQTQLQQLPDIVTATPYVNFTGLVEKGTTLKAIQIRGVDNQQAKDKFQYASYLKAHVWKQFLSGENKIILGQGVANLLKVNQGDNITLIMTGQQNDYIHIQQPRRIRLQVAGILDLSGELGYQFALIPLADAQQYLKLGDQVSGIMLTVKDVFHAYRVIYNAVISLNQSFEFRSWEFDYGYMYRDIQLIRSIMYLAMILVIGVACFNIVSTLVIAVKDKSSDIAILRTLGANNHLLRQIFTYYGVISGLIGCSWGIALGLLGAFNLTRIVKIIESITGHTVLAGKIYFIDFIPSKVHLSDIVIVSFTTIILSLFASWFAARRASKIDPVQVLSKN